MSAEQQGDVEEQTQTSLSNTPQPTPRVPEEKENESATVGDQVKEAEDSTPQISEETNGDSADPAAPTVEATENSQDNDAKVIAENAAGEGFASLSTMAEACINMNQNGCCKIKISYWRK